MQRKTPFRPDTEITQTYNDGAVTIYSASDGAVPGYQPVIVAKKKCLLHFEERVLGINRLYLSRQNQMEIKRVIRVPRVPIVTQDLARTHDGQWYRIDAVQNVKDVWPASLDLSLVAVRQNVEVHDDPD